MALYIGLMSGTSVDSIDAALVDFTPEHAPQLIAVANGEWSDAEKALINQLCAPDANELHNAGIVGTVYAKKCAELVKKLLHATHVQPAEIEAIGSHGQTVRHEPQLGFSVQLGNHALLAALTGIDVVCDFRAMDLACGGQGAPLVPAFHKEICAAPFKTRYIVNIGGIANVTALIPNKPIIGFDTGPGNTLLDLLARTTLDKSCDYNGELARQGQTNLNIVNLYLQDPYFAQMPPKSTGRELFNSTFIDRCQIFHTMELADRFATLTELTACSIVAGINILQAKGEIYICGGGVHNNFLMERINFHAMQAGHRLVAPITALGINPDYLEAFAFAWLAYKYKRQEALDLRAITGALIPSILGCCYPHPRDTNE